jgi:hypothetical protein
VSHPKVIKILYSRYIEQVQKYPSYTKRGSLNSQSNKYEILLQEELIPFSKILVVSNPPLAREFPPNAHALYEKK